MSERPLHNGPLPDMLAIDDSTRLITGHTFGEVRRLAANWWERIGRKCMHGDFKVQDVGLNSGVTRGLPWDHLDARERSEIIRKWYLFHLVAPAWKAGAVKLTDKTIDEIANIDRTVPQKPLVQQLGLIPAKGIA